MSDKHGSRRRRALFYGLNNFSERSIHRLFGFAWVTAMKITIENVWLHQAQETRAEAAIHPEGRYRDAMMRRASQLEDAGHLERRATSSGLGRPSGSGEVKGFSRH